MFYIKRFYLFIYFLPHFSRFYSTGDEPLDLSAKLEQAFLLTEHIEVRRIPRLVNSRRYSRSRQTFLFRPLQCVSCQILVITIKDKLKSSRSISNRKTSVSTDYFMNSTKTLCSLPGPPCGKSLNQREDWGGIWWKSGEGSAVNLGLWRPARGQECKPRAKASKIR